MSSKTFAQLKWEKDEPTSNNRFDRHVAVVVGACRSVTTTRHLTWIIT